VAVVSYLEVETSLGRSLSDAEIAQVNQWIDDAELLVRTRLGDLDALDQDVLAYVVREAAATRARNPEGYQYEAIDDYRYGMPAESRKVTITDEWWDLLTPTTRAGAYSVRPDFESDTSPTDALGWT